MLGKLFGNKDKPAFDFDVKFHKDANGHPEHGSLYVDHTQKGLKNEPIRFSFGDVHPANMTPELLTYIFDKAECQGYVVHCLRSYANIVTVQPAPRLESFGASKSNADGRPARQGISRGLRRPSGDRAQGAQQATPNAG